MTNYETKAEAILAVVEDAARELEGLQERVRYLVEFIRLGRILAGEPDEIVQATPSPHEQGDQVPFDPPANHHEQRSAADWGKALLEEVKHPMRVVDIAQELVRRGVLRGKWGREVLRAGMSRRDDLERIAVGVYAIREWSTEMKRWPRAMSGGSAKSPGRHRRGRRKVHVSLADEVLRIVEAAGREMSPAEAAKVLATMGRRVHANSVSGRFGELVRDGRLQKTGPGKYAPLGWRTVEDDSPNQLNRFAEETLVFTE